MGFFSSLFSGELTKFKVMAKSETIHCLKVLVMDSSTEFLMHTDLKMMYQCFP